MKLHTFVLAVAFGTAATLANAADGLIQVKSDRSVSATADKLDELARQRGLTVFARIDHGAGATKVGKTLRPTELLIFGNPNAGTPFMQCSQTVAIDLPLKALVWEDGSGQVWVGYNDPAYIAARHGVTQCPVVENIRMALSSLINATVAE